MTSKNSENSPLHIAEVRLEQGGGSLGLTLCPGKKDAGRSWNRDLSTDLQAIRAWGATTVSLSEILCVRHTIPSKEIHAPHPKQVRD